MTATEPHFHGVTRAHVANASPNLDWIQRGDVALYGYDFYPSDDDPVQCRMNLAYVRPIQTSTDTVFAWGVRVGGTWGQESRAGSLEAAKKGAARIVRALEVALAEASAARAEVSA